jgi:peptidoglycan/xylan/chitin deacetylase (PgdA/CDA1 family)
MNIKQKIIYPAEVLGIILLSAAFIFYFFYPYLAAAIASFYIVLCLAASFFPGTNFLGPVINRGRTGQRVVALTFDDGPAVPGTRQILDLLDKYSAPATFFVVGVNAGCHPEIIKEIIARGHTVGNHSFHHDPFLMLKGSKTIYREIIMAQETLRKIGVNTMAFRPPVGIVNPQLAPLLEKAGMHCITFSCRAVDAGNRRVKNISRKILKKVRSDDIILLHDTSPRRKEDGEILLTEIESVLAGLVAKGLKVVPLSVLTGKEIMSEGNKIEQKNSKNTN